MPLGSESGGCYRIWFDGETALSHTDASLIHQVYWRAAEHATGAHGTYILSLTDPTGRLLRYQSGYADGARPSGLNSDEESLKYQVRLDWWDEEGHRRRALLDYLLCKKLGWPALLFFRRQLTIDRNDHWSLAYIERRSGKKVRHGRVP